MHEFSRPQIALAAGRMQRANLDYNQYGYQVWRWDWGAGPSGKEWQKGQQGQLGHRGAVGGGRCPSGSLFACCRAIKIKWEMNVADAASRWRPGCMLRRYLRRTVTRFVCIRMQIGAASHCSPLAAINQLASHLIQLQGINNQRDWFHKLQIKMHEYFE